MTVTPIADMVDVMVEKGAPAPAIAVAVRALEASRDATVTRHASSRSKDALRAARYRKNIRKNGGLAKANDVATTVTNDRDASRDGVTERCDLTVLSSLSKPLKEEAEKKETRAVVVEGRKSTRGSRITEDFQPSDGARELARGLGLDPDALRVEFIDFWIAVPGSRGLKLDWDKTYKNRAREVAGRRKGMTHGQGRPRTVQQAAQDQLDRLREINDPAPTLQLQPGVRDGARPADVRLLPPGRRE